MDGARVRRKDTTKGPPLRILSLDGGGVRGYSVLIILQELMHRAFVEMEGRAPKRHEIPKPCDHFDLIAGTGTGGLIAIMLGRLRMDIETCKDVYVRMTRKVFETDKTFAGIPYRSTLFKASKLEEAIMECVREHTIYDDEGNDNYEGRNSTTDLHAHSSAPAKGRVHRSASIASRYSQIGSSPANPRAAAMKWGNPHAMLYDNREERTKTAVAAVYKGTRKASIGQVLLRSYDSRKEPAVAPNATIWQAGRATSATALAFKPIQIGQSVFLDEGTGRYNPAPMVLDEAACNEWPGREIGVFVSVGTGKRPDNTAAQEHLWWEGFVSGGIGDFAEARRKLISKIEGCEKTHREMKDHLAKRQVNPENYYRLNVNVGVGEFGMNEWNSLSDISTNTRMYLAERDVQGMTLDAAAKMARIHRAKMRWERSEKGPSPFSGLHPPAKNLPPIPDAEPFAIELPADDITPEIRASMHSDSLRPAPLNPHHDSDSDKYLVVSSDEHAQPMTPDSPVLVSPSFPSPRNSAEAFSSRPNTSTSHGSPRMSFEPPPRPPKTPLQQDVIAPPPKSALRPSPPIGSAFSRPPPGAPLPYPDDDGPPPMVNKASKPEYMR